MQKIKFIDCINEKYFDCEFYFLELSVSYLLLNELNNIRNSIELFPLLFCDVILFGYLFVRFFCAMLKISDDISNLLIRLKRRNNKEE